MRGCPGGAHRRGCDFEGRGSRRGPARAYLVLELADAELLHLLHALPLLLLETRSLGRCDAAVSDAWENLSCRVVGLTTGAGDRASD